MSNSTPATPAASTIVSACPAALSADLYRKTLDGLTDAQLYLSQSMLDLTAYKNAAIDADQFDIAATYRQAYEADREHYKTINRIVFDLQALLIKAKKGQVSHV